MHWRVPGGGKAAGAGGAQRMPGAARRVCVRVPVLAAVVNVHLRRPRVPGPPLGRAPPNPACTGGTRGVSKRGQLPSAAELGPRARRLWREREIRATAAGDNIEKT